MKGVERVPFCGDPVRLGKNNADSTVMLIHSKEIGHKVIKWNKCPIDSIEQAFNIVHFAQNSIELYEAVIGPDHILPTQFVIGEKRDQDKTKLKVYEVQSYVSGWTGKNLPEDLHEDSTILENWKKLYSRLSILYITADRINRQMKEEGKAEFPIKLTTGVFTRKAAIARDDLAYNHLPKTPNILIDRGDYGLKIADFGEYTPWNDDMETAYKQIFNRAAKAVNIIESGI